MIWFLKFNYFPVILSVYYFSPMPQNVLISLFFPYTVSHAWFLDFHSCYRLPVFLKSYLKSSAGFSFIFLDIDARDDVHTVLHYVLSMRVILRRRVCVELDHSWSLPGYYIDNRSFVSIRTIPSHRVGIQSLFSGSCYPLVPFYPLGCQWQWCR